MKLKLTNLGPGVIVTAAFVGPGTIATATHAGANYGFSLLWALIFSIGATIVLQEMAARLGLVTRKGLGEAIRDIVPHGPLKSISITLVVVAIGFGNAAFQTGNISGAAMALESIFMYESPIFALAIGTIAALLLLTSSYSLVERILILLVLAMSSIFLLTSLIILPEIFPLIKNTVISKNLSSNSAITAVALIGTTVVPYNLFLHSKAVSEKWPETISPDEAITQSRVDCGISLGVGGLITLAIMSTSAVAFFGTQIEVSTELISKQLEPLLGSASIYVFSAGLFASGLTSAITAPMAAAYAVSGVMGWQNSMSSNKFKCVWFSVLFLGTALASQNFNPIKAIVIAQVANGILLPLITIFLLIVMNSSLLPKRHRNGLIANLLGILTICLIAIITISKLPSLLN